MHLQDKGSSIISIAPQKKNILDDIFHSQGYGDYRWIDPKQIVVAQWVRMKCMYGCGEYGRGAACPPNTPSVAECERFFHEYSHAVILHFEGKMDTPEDRHAWSARINAKLVKLERAVFLAGFERAFMLFMDTCGLCKTCSGKNVKPASIPAWPGRPRRPWLSMSIPRYAGSDSRSTYAPTTTKKWTATRF